ncbi:MAG: filamentous hemagglutinin N-terminal domain-containing protein, partial [Rouxiella aceris]|uniref:two-partner secretion domain-containing protein n=1 Tax=Rouxiella aceris TaxID=2703884 RepID=UPI002848C0F1
MNKHCYRIIFSRTHGELRIVPEIARSCSTDSGQSRGPGTARLWVTVRRGAWLLSLLLFTSPVLAAGIVADNNAAPGQRPDVIATQNGLPQVNITAPNQAGISHNQYSQFDVDQKGAILNNSAVMTSTQMAGMIQGNPNLNPNQAPASVILNEVNSSNPSELRGYMEVAGGRAQVIIANPSGIVCNGCGTINAGRMTLTTGKPQLNADGSLAGYQVEQGVIRVEGGGLNGDSRQDTQYVDVLAREVEVNAGVWAKDKINVIAGRNRVSADGKTVVASADNGSAKPELAIDMGQLGGMYSGQIRMMGTEAGVGVRNQGGQLQAGKTLTVSSEGRLSWQAAPNEAVTQAGESISLTAKDGIEHNGKLHSGGTLDVQSREGDIKQSGTMAAAGNVSLNAAGNIENSGYLLAGSDVNSTLTSDADLTLTSKGDIRSSGSLLSKKNVALTGKYVDLRQVQLAAEQATISASDGGVGLQQARVDSKKLTVKTTGDVDARQAQVKTGKWDITANNLFNQQAAWSQTQSVESRFSLSGLLDNTGGTIEASNLSLISGSLNNQNGRLVALDNTAQQWKVTGLLDNGSGELGSNGSLTLNTGSLNNLTGSVKSLASLQISADGDVNNASGKLLAGADSNLKANHLNNRGGVISGDQLQLFSTQLDNAQGQVIGQQNVLIDAQRGINNSNGLIGAGQALVIQSAGDLSNQGGILQSDSRLNIIANNVNNAKGKILSGDTLNLNATGELDNHAGEVSGISLVINTRHLDNTTGKFIGQQSLSLNTADLINAQGLLAAGKGLILHADGKLDNQGGEISGNDIGITGARIDNVQGTIIAVQDTQLNIQDELGNGGGLIQAGGRLGVQAAGDWNNQSGAAQGGTYVNVGVRNLNNSQGRLQSGGTLDLNTIGEVKNLGGKLTAQDQLSWQSADAGLFSNDGGSLQSGGDMTLRGGSLSNHQQGVIFSQKGLSLTLGTDLDNRDGKITGSGISTFHAGNFYNAQGSVNALDSLDMQLTSTLDNGFGRIFSQGSQTLLAQNIANNQGWMGSQGKWWATTSRFDNAQGTVQTNQDAQLSATSLNNHQGMLQSAADLSLQVAQDIDNSTGKVSATNKLVVSGYENGKSSGSISNAGGQWLAGEILNISARAIDNSQGGLLYSQKLLTLDLADNLNNQQGKIQSGDALSLSAQALQNSGGALDSQQQLSLRILGELNNLGGTLRSEGDQQITARYFNNQNGLASSRSGLTVNVPQLDNGNGTLISLGAGDYDIDVLNNGNGKIHSGDKLKITGSQVNNTAGQLVSTQDLQLGASILNNNGRGIISSQAGLSIQSSTLNNSDGGSILGTAQTTITAQDIENTSGSLQAGGALTLVGLSQLDNRQGRIVSNGALNINAVNNLFARNMMVSGLSLLNQSGTVQSGGTLSASLLSLNNQGGTLQSQQGMNLSLAQDYTHRAGETLSSNGNLVLSVAGVLTNLTDWLLPGSLTLNASNIINPGRLVGKVLQLTTGSLQNTGRIDADSVTLVVDTLNNAATIMGDDVTVNGRVIDNYGAAAVIAATQSLDLQTRERLTNRDGALLYSSGRLHMSSGDLIENRASSIEADGDVTVEASRLDNLREGLVITRDAEQSDYKQHLYNYYWRSYGEDVNNDISTMAPTTQQLTFRNDAAAASNPYGTLLDIDAGAKRAQVQVKDKTGQLVSLWVNYLALIPNADGSYAMTFYETRGPRQRNVPTPYQNTVWWNATDSEKNEIWSPDRFIDIGSAPYVTDYNNLRERTITGTVTRDKLISAGNGASILSGGNMSLHIAGQLQNDAGTISSNGNLTIDGASNVINRGYSVNERRQEYIVDHYDRAEGHWYPTHNLDVTTALATIDGVISGHGHVSIVGTHIENTTVNQAQISGVDAALKAIDAEKAEWQRNPLAFSVGGASSQAADTALVTGIKGSVGGASSLKRPLLPAELALTALQQLKTVATSVPNNGLFRQNPVAGSPYLVVTDERFTSRTSFISSDYLLSRVGYDPAEVHKRLGDGFYEQKLVKDQVLSLTGRQSVQGEDAMEQYQNLMNNGIKVAQDFHLVPGIALTPEQIASLQQDIVWLVSETVDTASGPQTVWVPKVYLAQSTLRLTGNGALIAGGDLQLSANSVTNAGNVMADKALNIDTGQFSHLSGDIKAESIDVRADSLNISTNLQDALRRATMTASDISLSGNDIHLQGAKLDALKNLSVSARDNLEISAAKSSVKADLQVISGSMGNRTSEGIEQPGKRMAQVSGEWQQALGSELNAGGDLVLKAGQNMTLQGSQARAGGDLGLQAGGDIKILADKTTNSTQLGANSRTSSVSNTRSEDNSLLSTISGKSGVTLIAGKDLLAEGAQVDSTAGRIGLSAENVTIKAATESTLATDVENTQKGKSKGQRLDETASQKAIGSTFSAEDGVTTIARGGDIVVSGSTLHSEKGEIALSAKKDVTLNSVTESESQYLEERSQHSGMLSKSSSHTVQDDRITTEKGTLLSGNTIKISAGNDVTVTGSAIAADQDVALKAGNNVTISAATETESHYLLEEQSKSGLMSSGGIGFTVGSQSSRHEVDAQGTTQSQSFSTIGSSQGNVSIMAGNKLNIGGTDLVAGKDLSLSGDSVVIDSGFDQHNRTETFESKQSGLTLALSGTVGSALNTAVSEAQQARKESDSRLSALQVTKAALSGAQAAVAYEQDEAISEAAAAKNAAAGIGPDNKDAAQGAKNTVGVSLSYGSQSSKSESHSQSSQAQGSTLNAGRNISITATGKNKGDESGDISIVGSQLKAGGNISLDAA